MSNEYTAQLSQAGVSIWLDDLSRERLSSGSLRELVETRDVVGVTTNPAIFAQAITAGIGYAEKISHFAEQGYTAQETISALTCDDVADACDVLAGVFAQSNGRDGWVSIEVDPALAHDTATTVTAAQSLYARINKPNVMIKIPATDAGLQAITQTLALGISVNVTLIFSLSQYRQVLNAHQTGLELARAAGKDLTKIHSVASLFVSRLDTVVHQHLDATDTSSEVERFRAGVSNARLAYEIYSQHALTLRSEMLSEAGAHPQRLLWASTGVKDITIDPTLYVAQLALPGTVNTMPAGTLDAVASGVTIPTTTELLAYREADLVLNELSHHGVDYAGVTQQLADTGLRQFEQAWESLHQMVDIALQEAKN